MATTVTGWLSPLLFCASVVLLGRSFWVMYVRGIRTRWTTIATWSSLAFMVVFWSWYLWSGGWQTIDAANDDPETACVYRDE